jgi:uncharacterized protein (DUF58 family)
MGRIDDARIRGVFSAKNILLFAVIVFPIALVALPSTAPQAGFTAFIITAAVWLRVISRNQLNTIHVERQHHPRVFEGEKVPVALHLRRGGGLTIQMIELRDQFMASIESDQRQLVPVLTDGWEVVIHYEHTADRHRGLYTLGPLLVRASDPLGVFFEEAEIPCLTDLTVYPKADPLPFYTIPGPQPAGGSSMDFVSQLGYGEEILGVREYQAGDPPARIHWRTSARRGQFHVLQLNRPIQVEAAVLVDLTRRSRFGLGAEATTELAIRAAISILTRAHEARHRFSLAYAHEQPVCFPAGAGISHLHMLLDRLAVIQPAGEADFWETCGVRALTLTPGSRAVFIVAAMCTPPLRAMELIEELVANSIAVDVVLIDERDFIRIYRDQEFNPRTAGPEFGELAAALGRAGARVFPLGRSQPRLAPEGPVR